MLYRFGFFAVDASKADEITDECERDNWRIFRLPADIVSKDEFFEAVRSTFPLNPKLHSNRSWDALADSLWSGLDGLSEKNIVITWSDTFLMEVGAPEDFAIALNILMELPSSLSSAEATAGKTKQVLVLHVNEVMPG